MESIQKSRNNALALHFQSALQIPANEFSATSSVGEDVLLAVFYKGGKMRLRGENQDFKISNSLQVAGFCGQEVV